jgi:hypothetical protein
MPNGDLSPLQAHIDLALPPNRGLPDAVLGVDLDFLRAAGFKVSEPIQAMRWYGMPGGGIERMVNFEPGIGIPSQFFWRVR